MSARLLRSPLFWIGAVLVATAGSLGAIVVANPARGQATRAVVTSDPRGASEPAKEGAPLPVLATLPPFTLVDQDGRAFGLESMRGKVWVADFVFLGCSEVCPRLTARLKKVGERLAADADAALVTFSVDPTNDTPERLRAYAQAHGAEPGRWTFVTGAADEVERTVVKGFKIAVGKEPTVAADGKTEIFQIFHGEHFVLVDREGRIRGYYGSEESQHDALVRDVRRLLAEGAAPGQGAAR